MIVDKSSEKELYGSRLTGIPYRDLHLPELAQLYAYLVKKHGEDHLYCRDVLDHLREWDDDKADDSLEASYEEGYQAALNEMETYDDGYDAGYEDAKREFGPSEDEPKSSIDFSQLESKPND